jgi:uncharacterized membrane protein
MTLRFDEPWFFVGLVICLPMAWVALRWFAGMSAARRWSAVILRVALVAVLLAMLAGASMVRTSDRVAVIACIDRSGSVDSFFAPTGPDGKPVDRIAAIRTFLDASSKSRRPDDLSGVVLFGQSPIAAGTAGVGGFRVPGEWSGPSAGTNIEQALRLAGAMVPPGAAGRIVLFSDGVQTAGDALSAARALAGAGALGRRAIPIECVPFSYAVDHEVVMESLDTPPTAQASATVPVRVVINSTGQASGTLRLLREGTSVNIARGGGGGASADTGLHLNLEPGRHVEVLKVALPEGRIHRFEALWEPDAGPAGGDTVAGNNRAEAVTVSPGKGAILIVDGVSGGDEHGPGSTLGNTLRTAGLQVQTIGADAVRADLLWLQQFDAVILQNVPAEGVPREAHSTLVAAVNQLGLGLVMVGGPDSFGAGGWKGTDIEPVLPVKLDLPEKLVTPAAAVVLVIDNSGSMNHSVLGSNRSQQDIADEGAAMAIESMDKSDLVGVITFNSDYTVDVPLAPNKDPKATAKLVRSIGADGGTYMPPALAEAHRQIRAAKADVKHIIVLSDGVSLGKDKLPSMVEEIAADGIRVSTIAIGNQSDTDMMADMAARGKGQFYRVIDPNVLPRVLVKAVRIVRSPLVREAVFTPVVLPTGSPVLEGVGAVMGGSMAPLRGLVLTQARSDPSVVQVLATPKVEGRDGGGEPVLAYWNVGLGRVAAFTSDAQPRWAALWLEASGGAGYSRFWSQLVRVIARPPLSARTQELAGTFDGDRLTLRLRASSESGGALDGLSVPGTVYGPRGTKLGVRLSQVGPGEYETTVNLRDADNDQSGAYVVVLEPRSTIAGTVHALPPVVGGVSRPSAGAAEFLRLRSDEVSMAAIAKASGGSVHSLFAAPGSVPDLYSRAGLHPAEARVPLWPLLAVAAVVIMLLDTATRRVAWDRLFSRDMGAEVSRGVAAAMRDRSAQVSAAVGRLRQSPEDPAREAPEPSAAAPEMSLGDADAHALRERAATRRREARAAALRAGPPPIADAPGENPAQPAPEPEAGLRAAKERARRRIDEE